MSSFFSYFPTFLYSNTAAVNLIAKVAFDESVTKNLAVFYPYTLEEGERADQVAESYYDDPSYDWIVYMSNGIVDPVHEWPKDQNLFYSYLIEKYGTVDAAQARVAYYRVNYESDDTILSPAAYAALATGQKQYWNPLLDYNDQITGYTRKELEHIIETNRIVTLSGTFSNVVANDVIKQSGTVTGTVAFANTTTLTIKHVQGTWATSTPVYNVITDQPVSATITTVTPTQNCIPSAEVSYWSPVSFYDMESEINEQRKNIRLLSSSYIDLVERDMKELLSL